MIKRFIIDFVGNIIFFDPIILIVGRAWTWPTDVLIGWIIASLVATGIGARGFTWFLKHIWYPVWRIEF